MLGIDAAWAWEEEKEEEEEEEEVEEEEMEAEEEEEEFDGKNGLKMEGLPLLLFKKELEEADDDVAAELEERGRGEEEAISVFNLRPTAKGNRLGKWDDDVGRGVEEDEDREGEEEEGAGAGMGEGERRGEEEGEGGGEDRGEGRTEASIVRERGDRISSDGGRGFSSKKRGGG